MRVDKKPDRLNSLAKWILYIILIITILISMVPFILIVSASFTEEETILVKGIHLIPTKFSLNAYMQILDFPEDIVNSYAVSINVLVIGTILNIFLTTLTAYPLSKQEYKFKDLTSFYLFFTVLFSGGMIPTYILFKQYLNLYDNIWVYIVPAFVAPSNVFLLRVFMQNISRSLYEAAEIDGASEFTMFCKIAIPLALPGILTVTFFIALGYWNDSTTGIYFINSLEKVNLPLFLNRYSSYVLEMKSKMISTGNASGVENIPENTMIYAITVITSLPMLLVFLKFQKYYVQGMTEGAVKE